MCTTPRTTQYDLYLITRVLYIQLINDHDFVILHKVCTVNHVNAYFIRVVII